MNNKTSGFTIVELLVVIVVIGILAAITIVSYTGITQRAKEASLKSDLDNSSKQIKLFQASDASGNYPTANVCPTPGPTEICLKTSGDNTYVYSPSNVSNSKTFNLTATNSIAAYRVTNDSAPTEWINWIAGIPATAMAGKYVRNTDLGSTYMYKTTNTAVASPQGAIGLDPNYLSNMVLVSPQAYPLVDFASEYPAQNACKAIGGRLPNTQELTAIFAGRATYGNNFQLSYYWSSTEYDGYSTYAVSLWDGSSAYGSKAYGDYVRCIVD